MQYAVYITRAEHWSFESRERVPITEQEWLEYVASDAEFRPAGPVPAIDAATGKPAFLVEREGHWEWVGHSQSGAYYPTFQYLRSGLIVRAPDDETLRKALAVARALKARVISDEEEVY